MAIFRKPRQETTLPPDPDTVIMRFLTLGGATVVVVERASPRYSERFDWVCLGCCGTIGPSAERDGPVRNSANKHAGECRALPMPEAPGAGIWWFTGMWPVGVGTARTVRPGGVARGARAEPRLLKGALKQRRSGRLGT